MPNMTRPGQYRTDVKLSVGRTQGVGLVVGHHISGVPAGMLKDLIAYRYLFQIGWLRLVLRKLWQWAPCAAALRRRS